MPKNTRPRYRVLTFTFLSIVLTATVLFTAALAYTPIDFEGLNTNGVPGKIVTTDYANRGVTFTEVWATDFSSVAPNFAHSGVMALAPCVGVGSENCVGPLNFSFCHDQREVRLWVGYTGQLATASQVIMRGFDGNGVEVTFDRADLGPSAGPIAIRTSLFIQTGVPKIRRVTVGFKDAENPVPTAFNIGLAIDDLEFNDQSPCSVVCPSGQAPAFSLSAPTNGQIVIHNTVTVQGNLPAANQGATLRINVTGPQGQTHSSGPHAVSPGPISLPNLGGLLFPGINSLVFTVNDCAGSYSLQRTVHFRADITKTRFLVVNDQSYAVGGAEIYVDGNMRGRTDQNGMLTLAPPIPAGTKVIARKMVYESPTDRDYHNVGSHQDWKGRWYISNLAVNNDGSLSADEVTVPADPAGHQIIRVRKRNTLVGLNLIVSLEWDASGAELENVKRQIIETSYRLYNATDGQVMIEQARIADEAAYWVSDTDIRVWADYSFNARAKRDAFFDTSSFWPWVDPYLRLSREDFDNPQEGAKAIVHELGHYLFGVRDEYQGAFWGDSYCTAKLKSADPPYAPNSEYAACVMNTHWDTNKFCSHRPENPHRIGTEQGIASCWQNILAAFSDSDNRWALQSPETRGAIVGQVNNGSLPLPVWAPIVSVENRGKPFLCEPKLFRFVEADGTPVRGREIELTDFLGTWSITEGVTDTNGEIKVAGMHLGDRVGGRHVSTCTVTAQNVNPANDRLQIVPAAYSVPQTGSQSSTPQVVTVEPRRFDVFTELKPLKRDEAEISVYVKTLSGAPLTIDQPPAVSAWSRDLGEVVNVSTKYKASRAAFVGTLRKLPSDGRVQIRVHATNRSGETETAKGWFQIAGNDPDDGTEIFSPNGRLSLRVPKDSLPRDAIVSIGPATMTPPVLPSGYEVVSGPYSIWWSTDNCLPRFGRLNFELSRRPSRSAMAGYVRDTFTILYYNPDMRRWENIGGAVYPAPFDIVSQRIGLVGNYVLVARRDAAKQRGRWSE